jgi:hypothetical protein
MSTLTLRQQSLPGALGRGLCRHPIVLLGFLMLGQSKMHWRIVAEALLMVWRLRLSPVPPPLLGEAHL